SLAVRITQISFDGEVLAEAMESKSLDICCIAQAFETGSRGERNRARACQNLRRIVEENLVNDARVQRSPVDHSAAFNEQARDLELSEQLHEACEARASVGRSCGKLFDTNTMLAQNLLAFFFCEGTNDQHVLTSAVYEPRLER